MTLYAKCPNGCTGEVPMEVEETSGPDPDVGLPNGSYVVYVDDDANATSHDDSCPPLTDAQREELESKADVEDYLQSQAEQWAEIGL